MEMESGHVAWLLMSSALVLFMTPGLALFYGGMVRAKNVLNMLMMNFFTISIVTVLWILIGYTLIFGESIGGIIGGFDFIAVLIGLFMVNLIQPGVGLAALSETVPEGLEDKHAGISDILRSLVSPNLIASAAEMQLLPLILFCLLPV